MLRQRFCHIQSLTELEEIAAEWLSKDAEFHPAEEVAGRGRGDGIGAGRADVEDEGSELGSRVGEAHFREAMNPALTR